MPLQPIESARTSKKKSIASSCNSKCPHCGGELIANSDYCCHCGRRVRDYEICFECKEPVNQNARYCPYCSQRVRKSHKSNIHVNSQTMNLAIRATRMGALVSGFSITGFLKPPFIHAHNEVLRITRWSFLGLSKGKQEVQVTKIVSVRYSKGIIWGGILIEIQDDEKGTEDLIRIGGFYQHEAQRMTSLLQSVLSI